MLIRVDKYTYKTPKRCPCSVVPQYVNAHTTSSKIPGQRIPGFPKKTDFDTSTTESRHIMASKTSILMIGLDFDWTTKNRPMLAGRATDEIIAGLKEAFAQLDNVQGLYYKTVLLVPNSEGKIPDDVYQLIRNGPPAESGAGKTWDGVLLGFGIRSDLELTPAFEELVNYTRETLPSARLMFSGMPNDQLPCVLRHFSQIKQ